MILPISHKRSGFTVIELLMAIALIAILSVVSLDLISDSVDEGRFEETVVKLDQIRNAMIGNPQIREGATRTSFGFMGDIGAIPTVGQGIAALITKPGALPSYAINSTAKFGLGWNGPYLSSGNSATDFTVDAWGTAIVYTPGGSPPTLVSYGADLVAGGTGFNQDITVNLPDELRVATVSGFLCEAGAPFISDAEVEMNYPDGSGALTQSLSTLAAVDEGEFSFASVPMGIRTITIYKPSKAAPTTTVGPVSITVDKINTFVPCDRIDLGV